MDPGHTPLWMTSLRGRATSPLHVPLRSPLRCSERPLRYSCSDLHSLRMARNDQRPAHHANDAGTAFQNPWMQPKGLLASGQVLSQFPIAFARRLEDHPMKPISVVRPDFGGDVLTTDAIRATWLGHAVRDNHAV
jgi:hypothetical protein